MSTEEIRELMKLKGWTNTKLAAALDMSENGVKRWFVGDRHPSGPASILMRMWLDEARRQARRTAVTV
jgi:DNA-binding transcriptional regulator YiaG